MNKSLILYGPQGCGKTRNSARLAKMYGLNTVVDEAENAAMPIHRPNTGVLYLTGNEEFAKKKMNEGWTVVFYVEAMAHLAMTHPGMKE